MIGCMKHGKPIGRQRAVPVLQRITRTRGTTLVNMRRRLFSEKPLCAHCEQAGRFTPAVELDHIVPIAHGGTDDWSNLQGLCVECHRVKSAKESGKKPRPTTGVDGWPVAER